MSKTMNIAFLVFVLLYMLGLFYVVDFLWLLKIIPIAITGVSVFKTQASSSRSVLIVALVFSGCGDLLLAFDEFIFGVAAFLLAQLSYALIFKAYWQSISTRWAMSVGLLIYMVFMAWLLLPSLGDLQLPVMAYLLVISAMGLLAVQSSLPIRWAVLGAVVFIISDSLIAVNKFISPVPFESYWIMSTYYAAQFMLVTSLLKSAKPQSKARKN
jgi:uncharacterized membrane protein YhhN